MHVRFSSCRGIAVLIDHTHEFVGHVDDLLIHPDTGKIEGFYVQVPRFLYSETFFLTSVDVVRFGTHVYVSDFESLCQPDDIVRVQEILEDDRRILWQKIVTESGVKLGRCMDVQFNTESMRCEWLFPRKWGHWGVALPLSEIVEVQPEKIIVRDTAVFAKETGEVPVDVFDKVPAEA